MTSLKYLILDVDGTFTDGGVYYDNAGNELKKFCTKDGTGIVIARAAGIHLIVLTGRECEATIRRMTELHIDDVVQGVTDKASWLKLWLAEKKVNKEEIGYLGDDLNDLDSMKLCGWIGCPADAAAEVKEAANYISNLKGGHGAVRDCIEHLLREEKIWKEVVDKVYGAGV